MHCRDGDVESIVQGSGWQRIALDQGLRKIHDSIRDSKKRQGRQGIDASYRRIGITSPRFLHRNLRRVEIESAPL